MIHKLFKSIIDQDCAPIVVCDVESVIVYMNPSAVKRYRQDLTGSNLKDCHNAKSNEMIDKVLAWFRESRNHNLIYTFHNEKENKDVYMVALRDETGNLIGYYEKHEYRTTETRKTYDFCENDSKR